MEAKLALLGSADGGWMGCIWIPGLRMGKDDGPGSDDACAGIASSEGF